MHPSEACVGSAHSGVQLRCERHASRCPNRAAPVSRCVLYVGVFGWSGRALSMCLDGVSLVVNRAQVHALLRSALLQEMR